MTGADISAAWTILLKDYIGSFDVSFSLMRPNAVHPNSLHLCLTEKTTVNQLYQEIEKQLASSYEHDTKEDVSYRTQLHIRDARFEKSTGKTAENGSISKNLLVTNGFPEEKLDLWLDAVISDDERQVRYLRGRARHITGESWNSYSTLFARSNNEKT